MNKKLKYTEFFIGITAVLAGIVGLTSSDWIDIFDSLLTIFIGLYIALYFPLSRKVKSRKNKYRVGRKSKRAILYIETGHEYLIFPQGKEKECQEYCDFLNSHNY